MYQIDVPGTNIQLISNGEFTSDWAENFLSQIRDRIIGDIYAGSGVPAAGLGEDGDGFVDLGGLDFYTKSSGSWSLSFSLGNTSSTTIRLINGEPS